MIAIIQLFFCQGTSENVLFHHTANISNTTETEGTFFFLWRCGGTQGQAPLTCQNCQNKPFTTSWGLLRFDLIFLFSITKIHSELHFTSKSLSFFTPLLTSVTVLQLIWNICLRHTLCCYRHTTKQEHSISYRFIKHWYDSELSKLFNNNMVLTPIMTSTTMNVLVKHLFTGAIFHNFHKNFSLDSPKPKYCLTDQKRFCCAFTPHTVYVSWPRRSTIFSLLKLTAALTSWKHIVQCRWDSGERNFGLQRSRRSFQEALHICAQKKQNCISRDRHRPFGSLMWR